MNSDSSDTDDATSSITSSRNSSTPASGGAEPAAAAAAAASAADRTGAAAGKRRRQGKEPETRAGLQRKRHRSLSPDSDDDVGGKGSTGNMQPPRQVPRRQNSISKKLEQLKATIGGMAGDDGDEDDEATDISFVGPELPDNWTIQVHYPARAEPYEFAVTPASAVWDMMSKIAADIGADPKYVQISWNGKPLDKWVELGRVGLSKDDDLCS